MRGRPPLLDALARAALAAASLAAGVLACEGWLTARGRPKGWGYATGWGVDDFAARFRLRPGFSGELFGARVRVNSLGARGPEPGRPGILYLGDSVSFGVGVAEEETFPGLLSRGGREGLNFGTPGYNAFQGRALYASARLKALRPALVVAYFGWNDHWRCLAPESAYARARALSGRWRLAALALKTQECFWSEEPRMRRRRLVPQVPLAEFRDSLAWIVEEARRRGAVPVLVTPAYEPRLLDPASTFVANHSAREFKDHWSYLEAVRETARLTGAGLVDLEEILRRRRTDDPRTFFLDFAHLSPEGHRVLAEALAPWADCARALSCPPDGPGPS